MKKIYILALALIMSAGLASQVYAQSGSDDRDDDSNKIELKGEVRGGLKMDDDYKRGWEYGDHSPKVFGTVTAISGNTITITNKGGAATTTYTVDATNAKIEKAGDSVALSSIVVGSSILVEGTINGSSIVAKEIKFGNRDDKNLNPMLEGNGQPIIGGKVTAVSGSTITVTTKSNIAYTVNLANAKIVKGGNTAVMADVVVGDTVLVQGTINGTSVVATSVIDQEVSKNTNSDNGKKKGFFRKFGGWFSRIFGF